MSSKTPLAWLNLRHDVSRTLVGVAGVAFAVILVLMQLGFYGSVLRSATLIYDRLDFDLMLVSPQYLFFSKSGSFPEARLYQALGVPEVVRADPLRLGFHLWRNTATGRRRGMLVMGIESDGSVFDHPEIQTGLPAISTASHVLFDLRSRDEFGPRQVGLETEIGGQRVRVAGHFSLGTGFGADGAIVVSDRTFREIFPFVPPHDVNLGLLELAEGADADTVARALRDRLPPDVHVFTRAELIGHEQTHWVVKTSVGIIFGLGVLVAILVGTAIVYQVLSSDIAKRLPEFATLKAMGYGERYLSRVVLGQALILAVAGYVPALVLSLLLYRVTHDVAKIPIEMTPLRAIVVLGLSLAMCASSALLSLRKVHTADPADLF